jgi:predicted CXXCH cytochrome family protein
MILLLALVFLASAGALHLRAQTGAAPAGQAKSPTFVGSTTCATCHQREAAAWQGSQHAHAMQHAKGAAVLGDFNGATYIKEGVTTTFVKHDDKFFVRTAGPDGRPGEFEVKFTFGVAPLQQYLVAMPAGRLQAFGIAWDTRPRSAGGQRWFDLYPGQKLLPGDPLHWTGIQQTANYMCIDCHVTNLRKGFDEAANSYGSTWSEPGVGCEACHGPGGAHVADPHIRLPAQSPSRTGIAWGTDPAARPQVPRPAPGQLAEVETCGRCHARRSQLTDDIHAGQPLADGFRVSLLEHGLYRADGQMRDEVFNHGSFLQSRMFSKGVTCSDCHDPHTQKLRAEGNALCEQCHQPAKYDTRAHTLHDPMSKAGQCVSCHMPVVTYMIVDPRHDHSFRVPRPDLAASLGTPDVCGSCHGDKPAGWAADQLRLKLGRAPSGFQDFAEAFHAADTGAPGAASLIARIADDPAEPAIVRASAIARAAALDRALGGLDLQSAASSPDALLRAAAAEATGGLEPSRRLALLAPLLRDPARQVRIEAAAALASVPEMQLADPDRAAFRAALAEYVAVQRYNADRGEAHTNLALLEIRRGNGLLADAHLARAIAIDPTFVPAYVLQADLYRGRRDEDGADAILRRALERNPGSGLAHHALGLSLIRQRKLGPAVDELRKASELEPDSARYGYVYAVALAQTGRGPEAVQALDAVLKRHPYDVDALSAAAGWAMQRGDRQAALGHLMTLRALRPDDGTIRQELDRLQRMPQQRQ